MPMVNLHLNNRNIPLSESRVSRMLTGNRDDALYMGFWDKFCDFFRTNGNKKAEILEYVWDFLNVNNSQASPEDIAETDEVKNQLNRSVRLFNKLKELADQNSKHLFRLYGNTCNLGHQSIQVFQFCIGDTELKTLSFTSPQNEDNKHVITGHNFFQQYYFETKKQNSSSVTYDLPLNNLKTLLWAQVPVKELLVAQVPVKELRAAQVSVKKLLAAQVSVEELLAAQVSVEELLAAQVSVKKLRAAQVSVEELRAAQVPVKELRAAQVPVKELLAAQVSVEELLAAQVSVKELLAAQVSVEVLYNAGASVSELLAAQVSVKELLAAQVSVKKLRAAQVSVEELLAAQVSVEELRAAQV
ncbi:hypothetical protein NY904_004545, partial [Escherichia coli]|nr:hypothetical protein [Escherichia coli]